MPGQIFNDPLAEITGVVGPAAALTAIGAEVPEHVPLPAVTE